jgi:hypothetical protein
VNGIRGPGRVGVEAPNQWQAPVLSIELPGPPDHTRPHGCPKRVRGMLGRVAGWRSTIAPASACDTIPNMHSAGCGHPPGMMPLQSRRDGCAAITRAIGGQWGPPCDRPPTVRAVWRFESGPRRILLCEEHAAELADHERLAFHP